MLPGHKQRQQHNLRRYYVEVDLIFGVCAGGGGGGGGGEGVCVGEGAGLGLRRVGLGLRRLGSNGQAQPRNLAPKTSRMGPLCIIIYCEHVWQVFEAEIFNVPTNLQSATAIILS